MIVSHYENNYGGAVRTLSALRSELAGLETGMPGYRIRALKREELIAMGSVALHELYFGNLGGEGNKIPDPVHAMLEEHFGSVARWRREFVETAQSLAGGSGWVLLSYSRRDRRLVNQVAFDHSQAAVDAAPVLALDMYEHAYHMDFGANATAYIDAFMRNVHWTAVTRRMAGGRLLRVRLSRRLQRDQDAQGARLRRTLHPRRNLRLVCGRRSAGDAGGVGWGERPGFAGPLLDQQQPPAGVFRSTSSRRVSSGPFMNAMRGPFGFWIGPSSSVAPRPLSRAMSASLSCESKPKCSRPWCGLASPAPSRSFVRAPEMLTAKPSSLVQRTKRWPNT